MPALQKVAVVGQGYVGLPLAHSLIEAGYRVFGIDTNESRVRTISSGESPIEDISHSQIQKMLSSGNYNITSDFQQLSEVDISVICVPTPVDLENKPDLSALN